MKIICGCGKEWNDIPETLDEALERKTEEIKDFWLHCLSMCIGLTKLKKEKLK